MVYREEQALELVRESFPDAQLVEVRDIGIPWCDAFDRHLAEVRLEGQQFVLYSELRWIATELGRKPGWAAVVFKEEIGHWPPWDWKDRPMQIEPREETLKMVRRRDRKSRQAWKEQKRAERLEAQGGEEALFDAAAAAREDSGLEGELGDAY